MFQYIRNQGYRWNHKRVQRIYRELQLNLRVKPKKRLPSRQPTPLVQPETTNESWSVDFMSDSLRSGRTFRTFNVIDDFNRNYNFDRLIFFDSDTIVLEEPYKLLVHNHNVAASPSWYNIVGANNTQHPNYRYWQDLSELFGFDLSASPSVNLHFEKEKFLGNVIKALSGEVITPLEKNNNPFYIPPIESLVFVHTSSLDTEINFN